MAAPQPQQLRFVKADYDNQMMPEPAVNEGLFTSEPAKFHLKVYGKDRELIREIPLNKYAPIYVGRAIGCQIDLMDISISRRHCVLHYKNLIMQAQDPPITGFCIYDLKSTHGTCLNGERIPSMQNIQLNPGDVIRFGLFDSDFEFHEIENVETANPTADSTTEQQQEHQDASTVANRSLGWSKLALQEVEQLPGLTDQERTKRISAMKDDLKEILRRLGPSTAVDENETASESGHHVDDAPPLPPPPAQQPATGRKRRAKAQNIQNGSGGGGEETPPPKKRGRQPKRQLDDAEITAATPKKRGRKKRVATEPAEEYSTAAPTAATNMVNGTAPVIKKRRGRKPRNPTVVDMFEKVTPDVTNFTSNTVDFELDPIMTEITSQNSKSTGVLVPPKVKGKRGRPKKEAKVAPLTLKITRTTDEQTTQFVVSPSKDSETPATTTALDAATAAEIVQNPTKRSRKARPKKLVDPCSSPTRLLTFTNTDAGATQPKRRRGRQPAAAAATLQRTEDAPPTDDEDDIPIAKRGRPRKDATAAAVTTAGPKRGRKGRKSKATASQEPSATRDNITTPEYFNESDIVHCDPEFRETIILNTYPKIFLNRVPSSSSSVSSSPPLAVETDTNVELEPVPEVINPPQEELPPPPVEAAEVPQLTEDEDEGVPQE